LHSADHERAGLSSDTCQQDFGDNPPSVTGELIQSVVAGDRKAMQTLYESYSPRLHRVILRVVGANDADDVLHEAFIKVFRKLETFQGESDISTWLYRLAVNEALQHLRKNKKHTRAIEKVPIENVLATQSTSQLEQREVLKLALAELDAPLKVILELKEVDHLSYSQIAKIMDIPEGTVGSRLNRARFELKEKLTRLGWEF
jgi:RNA polymerase sigma-70 factor (ECF subfamily)